MSGNVRKWLRVVGRRLVRVRGENPAPEFVRVAYCVPRQVVLVTTRFQEQENVWPVDWHIPLSLSPKLYGLALNRSGYGTELVRASGVFVVNFVPVTWEEVIFFCGRTSGRQVDKFAATGLAKEEAQTVDAPRLADALGVLECRDVRAVETGDHTFFVGEVTHEVFRGQAPRLHHLDSGLRDIAEEFE